MSKTVRTLAIMFADISGSTRLYETLGDTVAREIVANCLELLSQVTSVHKGTVVKTIGDEVMCTFLSVPDAAKAALQMQEDVIKQGESINVNLTIRVGFHIGPVILERGDVFGDAVNLAARMAAQAKSQQIITTKETVDLLPPALKSCTRLVDTARVKGKENALEMFELTWGAEDDLTVMKGIPRAMEMPGTKQVSLKVRFTDIQAEVNEARPSMTMGRGPENEFVVPDTMASRQHASLVCRRGKFFLVDKSTNGTYLMTADGQRWFLHREETELQLDCEGVIGLGREVSFEMPEAIYYTFS